MLNRMVVSASVFCAVVLAGSGLAFGQAVVGPGDQTGSAGAETEFAFSLDNGGANVAIFGFNMVITTAIEAVLEPVLKEGGQPGEVDCTVEPDLGDAFGALVFVLDGATEEDPDLLAVSFGDLAFPLTNLPRDGVIGRCKFRVITGVLPATITLPCDTTPGSTSATDAEAAEVPVTCEDGTLMIVEQPTPTATATATTAPPEEPTPTNTVRPPTAVPGGDGDDDDGCNISTQSGGSSMTWLLLAPVAALVLRRRRAK